MIIKKINVVVEGHLRVNAALSEEKYKEKLAIYNNKKKEKK